MKIGVIGTGKMGKNHVRIYSDLRGVDELYVTDMNKEAGQEVAKAYNANFVDSMEELLSSVDAVSICTPTSAHFDTAKQVIEAGVHCLIEKPVTASIEEAKTLEKLASGKDLVVGVGHIERFNPAVSKLKELIENSMLGDLLLVSARRVGPFVPRIMDVGIITDSASHDIDVIRYLIGSEPKQVFSLWRGLKNKRGDHALIVFDFGDTLASIEVNWFSPDKVRNLTVTGTKGTAALDYRDQELVVYNLDSKIIPKIEKAEPLRLELEHFIDCIINDKEPLVNAYEGFKVLEIATEAEKKYDTSC